ncbi:MAG: MmgE/PrpD family protein [Candidatus Methylomirabilales bacterium]
MGETRELTNFVVDTQYNDFPPEVIERAKVCVLDYLGSALYGSTKDWSRQICRYVQQMGCHGKSTVIANQLQTSPQYAALANGTMGHGFELDDFHTVAFVHPGAVVVPAALAMAQNVMASGEELLTAVILGYEVMVRLGLVMGIAHSVRGFHSTGTTGPFASATAAGKVMKLNKDRMLNAYGIAGSMASGLKEFYLEGGTVKRLHAGKAAENGVSAALLAKQGFTGPSTVLEGKFGFCRTYSDAWNLEKLQDNLKQEWQIMSMNTKPYACCGGIHPTVHGLLDLKKQYDLPAKEVKKVVVETCERIALQNAGPGNASIMSAQYSIPFCASLTLWKDIEDPSCFTEAVLRNEDILSLSTTVEVIGTPEISGMEESRVMVKMQDGQEYKKRINQPKGHPKNPLNYEEVVGKFKKLARHVYPDKRLAKIVEMVNNLEKARDLNPLCDALGK